MTFATYHNAVNHCVQPATSTPSHCVSACLVAGRIFDQRTMGGIGAMALFALMVCLVPAAALHPAPRAKSATQVRTRSAVLLLRGGYGGVPIKPLLCLRGGAADDGAVRQEPAVQTMVVEAATVQAARQSKKELARCGHLLRSGISFLGSSLRFLPKERIWRCRGGSSSLLCSG